MSCRTGPQFAKVFVRLVDWQAASEASAREAYEHATWRDPFVVVELPPNGSVDDLITVAVCRWGRAVVPYASLFLANGDGRRVSAPSSVGDVDADVALDSARLISDIPRVELPMSFVLITRPSRFVDKSIVASVLQRMQDIVAREIEEPRILRKNEREQRLATATLREANVLQLQEAEKRREVKAVLLSHQKEDQRVVSKPHR